LRSRRLAVIIARIKAPIGITIHMFERNDIVGGCCIEDSN